MRHFQCPSCQNRWDFEENTVQAMGTQLVCPLCQSQIIEAAQVEEEPAGSWLGERFLGAPSLDSSLAAGARIIFWTVVVWFSIPFFRLPMRLQDDHYTWLDRVNLIFHEAGHWIFGVFGNHLLTSAGGTLGQLLMPLILALAFFIKNRDCYAAGLGVWWVGESLVDCAPYINDARSLSLMLLGGGTGKEVEGHDWEFILGQLSLLDQDIYIARAVLLAGRIVMALGLGWMLLVIIRQVIGLVRQKLR